MADANVVGNVTRLGFNGYVYDSLRLDGCLRNRSSTAAITARDPNLDFRLLRTGGLQRLGAALRLYDGPAACRPGAPASTAATRCRSCRRTSWPTPEGVRWTT
ncbi:MAG: hypothetical protein ACLSHL_09335 [Alistipes communis]